MATLWTTPQIECKKIPPRFLLETRGTSWSEIRSCPWFNIFGRRFQLLRRPLKGQCPQNKWNYIEQWAQSNIIFWCEKRIFSLSLPLHCVFQGSRGNNMITYRASQKKLSFRICPKCPDFPRIAQNAPNCPNIQNWRKKLPRITQNALNCPRLVFGYVLLINSEKSFFWDAL